MTRDGTFRKATDSERTGCVEIAALPHGGIRIRDSKNRGGAVLNCTDQEWHRFIQAINRGEPGLRR